MDFADVVDVVSAVFGQLKAEPYISSFICRAINEVEASIEDLEQLKNFLTYDELKEWLESLLGLVYKIEDFADQKFVLRRMYASRMGFGRRFVFIVRRMLEVDTSGEMRESRLKIHRTIESLRMQELGVSRQRHPLDQEYSDVFGLESKGNLVTWLTDTDSRPNIGFILIAGKIGTNKTTLAAEIYKSEEILKRDFEFRAWVSASKEPVSNFRNILQQIGGHSTVDTESTIKELEGKICEILQKKRWLVVIDNLQSPYDIFNIIPRSALSDEGNGSRVIMTMTTRNEYLIKNFMDVLQPLRDEDAWNLFLKKGRLPDKIPSSDLDYKLKRTIIDICEGIPSAIVVLGRFLSTKKSYKEWFEVLGHPVISNLIHSDLTSGLRHCLLYFGLFPREYKIPVRRLLRLWVAEGLVISKTSSNSWEQEEENAPSSNPWEQEEENAVMYLEALNLLGIIEIDKKRKDGSPKTCRMPGILHDICLSKAEDIFGLPHIHPTTPDPESSSSDHASASPSPKFCVRRVSGDIKNYSPKEYSHMQQLRSYLSFNTQNKDMPALEIGNFLMEVIGRQGFGLLRVLDLERVYKPKLPENLGKLSLLRYLGLRWTFLDTLPHSVSELSYLETLDVKHTNISSPPSSIWKMQHLRHLCLNNIRLDMPLKKRSICLTGLQTLWGLFVDKNSPVKNGLDRSTNLRKLGLTVHLDNVEPLNEWIASLKQLKSLRLRSKNQIGHPSELKLNPLSGLEKLESLYLLGKLSKLDDQCFPKDLTVLTLSVSKLEKDPMPILAQLTELSVLRLLADSYTGKEMVCPNGGFQSLTILNLWMLKEFKTWTVEEGAMPILAELEIRCCHKLKELPVKLLNQIWIDKIILTNMQEEFVVNVRANIPEGKSSILEVPQPLPVRCHCQDEDDVKQVSIHSFID